MCWERVMRMELTGLRKRGRPKRRYMDVGREYVSEIGVTQEGAGRDVPRQFRLGGV